MPSKKPVQVVIEQKPYYEYKYVILVEDITKAKSCYQNIYKLVQKSKPIPAALIRELASYIRDKDSAIKKSNEFVLTRILQTTISFFSTNKDYQFEANRYDENEKKNIEFNFEACIDYCLVQYWATVWFRMQIGKENDILEAIRFLFKVLEEYTMPFNESPKKLLISDYKKVAISAYLCEQLGYYVPHVNSDKPLMPEYFDVGKNVIRKKRKKKKIP